MLQCFHGRRHFGFLKSPFHNSNRQLSPPLYRSPLHSNRPTKIIHPARNTDAQSLFTDRRTSGSCNVTMFSWPPPFCISQDAVSQLVQSTFSATIPFSLTFQPSKEDHSPRPNHWCTNQTCYDRPNDQYIDKLTQNFIGEENSTCSSRMRTPPHNVMLSSVIVSVGM
jgi:hypothetical protein